MSNLKNKTKTSMYFEMERKGDLFLIRLNGPFFLNVADVIGNPKTAIWSSLVSEKQVNSDQLMRKIIGKPYPMKDLFRVLCAKKSIVLKSKIQKDKATYSNSHVQITVSDFQPIENHPNPMKIEFFAPGDHLTELHVDYFELEKNAYIGSEQYRSRTERIKEAPL